jgi:hypothetical protein
MAAGREPQQAIMEEHLKMQVMIGMLRRPAAGLSLDGTTVRDAFAVTRRKG